MRRWRLLLGVGAVSMVLAYFLRDVIYDVVIVPLAYALWVGKLFYSAIPQWILWTVLLAVLILAVIWNMLPQGRISERKEPKRRPAKGAVEELAVWIVKSRHGNYFKWQLANRMGRIARSFNETSGPHTTFQSGDQAVDQYLDAGLNYSFVDFPTHRNRFERAPQTPLDLDPRKAADYLESQMENKSGRRG